MLRERDPLDEEAVRRLVSSLHQLGRRPEALRRYREFEQRLQTELAVPPISETMALVGKLKDTRPLPPRRSTDMVTLPIVQVIPSYPLPVSEPLVGRDTELKRVLALLPPAEGGREQWTA